MWTVSWGHKRKFCTPFPPLTVQINKQKSPTHQTRQNMQTNKQNINFKKRKFNSVLVYGTNMCIYISETKLPFDVEHHPLQHEWVLLQPPCTRSLTVISTHFKTFLEKHYYADHYYANTTSGVVNKRQKIGPWYHFIHHTVILFICTGALYSAEEQALKSLPSMQINLDLFKAMSVDSLSGQQGQLWSSAQCNLNCLPVECIPPLITAPLPWQCSGIAHFNCISEGQTTVYISQLHFLFIITPHWKTLSHLKWNINFPSKFPNLRDNMALKFYGDSAYE